MSYIVHYTFLGSKCETLLKSLNNLVSFSFIFFGTIILTSATKSPLPPLPSLYPFCGILITSPLCVPLGTITVTSSSIEEILALVPNAASQGVINKFEYKSYGL